MYYPGPCWPPYPHPYPYPGPWGGPLLAEATRSAAQPAASIAGMMAAPAIMPSLVDYCPPWPPIPPWWPWPPIPPWPPWRDVFNEMARTRTAAAPESSAPVTPSSREDFPDGAGSGSGNSNIYPLSSNVNIPFTENDRRTLTTALDFLKKYPRGKVTSSDEILRLTAVIGFLMGFFEAKGILSSTFDTLLLSESKQIMDDKSYDQMINALESVVNIPETRNPFLIGVAAGLAANALYDGAKWVYNEYIA